MFEKDRFGKKKKKKKKDGKKKWYFWLYRPIFSTDNFILSDIYQWGTTPTVNIKTVPINAATTTEIAPNGTLTATLTTQIATITTESTLPSSSGPA